MKKKISIIVLLGIAILGLVINNNSPENTPASYSLTNIPEHSDMPYVEINNNIPVFEKAKYPARVMNITVTLIILADAAVVLPLSAPKQCLQKKGRT